MEGVLKEIQKSKTRKRKVSFNEEGTDECEDAIDEAIAQEELQTPSQLLTKEVIGGDPKKKAKTIIPPMFAPRTTPGSQPSLKSVFQNKEALHEVDKRVARWLLDCRIPFNAVMSPFFQDMLDGVAGFGPGYKGPSYDSLRVNLLADLKRECQIVVDSYRSAWKETGCTLMADGWTDQRQRTLINFLVYCSKGLCFVKSVDASSMVKNASSLCDLFSEVIEWIGPDNIVHVVTDNATNYVAADISSMPHISSLATRASKITVFVYNHTVFLSWLRQRTGWREIVRPGATRFATVFLTLMSIFERKSDLQALVVNTYFTGHKLGMSANDADDKPSLGIVYEGMLGSENGIKEMFKQRKTAYQPYTEIINSIEARDVMRALLDLVTLHCKVNNLDSVEAMKEIHLYRDRKESFDRLEAVPAAKRLQPDEWWRLFGSSAPCLQNMAVRILSQASASSGYEIDAYLDQGGGGSSSTFYAAPLAFSGPSSGNEGDDINDANLQQVMEDFDDS
ncbi:uncharacterized protein LOC107614631 [Arachis ipaensis]|uniref:uncharacterized protein LOC107614631 n=1 Tax=Arachis ipaensis TaxID=130454 RepID=UPI0007AFD195|nr:uncharacterized protein LOC107614631 [Arachis ipaensis]XP_025675751.1 uncharacterized protein LOC112776016 [Arachis hypogaea]